MQSELTQPLRKFINRMKKKKIKQQQTNVVPTIHINYANIIAAFKEKQSEGAKASMVKPITTLNELRKTT